MTVSLRRVTRVTSLVCVAAWLGAVAAGCTEQPASTAAPAASHELPPAGTPPDDVSIFDLDLNLVDQAGARTTLVGLGGTPMVAAMVYTSCTDVCILVTEQMKAIERQVGSVGDDVRYVLFSLDPGRDTPEAMREFARVQKLDTSRWRLLAASEDGVRDLAAVLGVRYRSEQDGDIAHSAMIFVIDAAGVVRHRQMGVSPDGHALVEAVRQARR